MGNRRVAIVFTDPPFDVKIDGHAMVAVAMLDGAAREGVVPDTFPRFDALPSSLPNWLDVSATASKFICPI